MNGMAPGGSGLAAMGGGLFVFGSGPTAGWVGALTLLSGLVHLAFARPVIRGRMRTEAIQPAPRVGTVGEAMAVKVCRPRCA
jgi:hypothetical protein